MKGVSEGDDVVQSDISASEMKSLWETVLSDADLSGRFGTMFDTFWKPTKLINVSNNVYTVEVKNIFAKSQFEKKYEDDVRASVSDLLFLKGLTGDRSSIRLR